MSFRCGKKHKGYLIFSEQDQGLHITSASETCGQQTESISPAVFSHLNTSGLSPRLTELWSATLMSGSKPFHENTVVYHDRTLPSRTMKKDLRC